MSPRLLVLHAVVAICVAVSATACSPPATSPQEAGGTAPQEAPAPKLRADVSFACLWWSEAQMEGLNPDAPPPKNTEVRITKWEYSDPVGVPHPDVVDIVVTLVDSSGQARSDLEVEVATEWKEGSLRDATDAVWSRATVIQNFSNVSIGSSGQQTLRVPVDLEAVMDSLAQQQKWPYGLRATATVRDRNSVERLVEGAAELPIQRGD